MERANETFVSGSDGSIEYLGDEDDMVRAKNINNS